MIAGRACLLSASFCRSSTADRSPSLSVDWPTCPPARSSADSSGRSPVRQAIWFGRDRVLNSAIRRYVWFGTSDGRRSAARLVEKSYMISSCWPAHRVSTGRRIQRLDFTSWRLAFISRNMYTTSIIVKVVIRVRNLVF